MIDTTVTFEKGSFYYLYHIQIKYYVISECTEVDEDTIKFDDLMISNNTEACKLMGWRISHLRVLRTFTNIKEVSAEENPEYFL